MASSATIRGGIATRDLPNSNRLSFAAAQISRRSSLSIYLRRRNSAISISASSAQISRSDRGRRSGHSEESPVAYEKLEEWMRDSVTVTEIVKNLRRAPLMVHVYGGESPVVKKAEEWNEAKGRWEAGDSPVPEGLIFVEELSDRITGEGEEERERDEKSVCNGVTKAFGVVVQGRGSECPPVCYLLKASMAGFGYGSGCGLGCTHFCLVRVNGFRETTESQLKNSWLS